MKQKKKVKMDHEKAEWNNYIYTWREGDTMGEGTAHDPRDLLEGYKWWRLKDLKWRRRIKRLIKQNKREGLYDE